jgi:hypothetical protein
MLSSFCRTQKVSRKLPAVKPVVVGGERYLVSMLGEEVNWVRNVKAAGATSPYAMVVARGCAWKRLRQIVARLS